MSPVITDAITAVIAVLIMPQLALTGLRFATFLIAQSGTQRRRRERRG